MRRGLAACGALGLLACAFGASLAAPVTVDATLDRRSVTVGEAATLQVIVRGAPIGVDAPTLDLPSGLDVLSTGRANNFTFVDGKSAVEAIFRYQIAANAAGRYGIGPIAVHVGKETFRSLLVHLDASAAPSHLGAEPASAGTAAALFVDVAPARPWVGQPCVMRVRLVQRAPLAEDPQYTPPATPGFWSDPTGAPESYYADEHGRRVLVTETRARLYPLAPGPATIGEASATLVLAVGPRDPTPWTSARAPRHEVAVRSAPVAVDVRALPPGAPRGFNGAVGDFTPGWTADRARTSLDVPVTVRLDVRGHGNLPLLRPPELAAPDAEVFAGTMDDSLASPGGDGVGRKRFQWSALARGVGRLAVPAPRFAWFDPGAGAYRVADLPAVAIDVGPALFAGAAGGPGLPAAFAAGTDPGARAPAPWAWALGGLLIGAALVVARGGADPRAAVAARARPLEWLRAVGRTNGPDFWRAAEDASAWLATGGHDAESVRRDIAAARFGGTGIDVERVRRELVEAISAALPPRRRSAARRATAVVLVLAAAAVMTAFAPRAGDAPLAARMRAAD
ncbi:MAG: BatD family protein, partial [Candidatus Eisenbacteria bacterium]|nr:BatD family protein [Candidatus Eisenbacteria bacterium]